MKKCLWMAPLALVCALGACDDMLVEEPEAFLTTSNYYRTATDMDKAVLAGYNSVRAIYNGSNGAWWGSVGLATDQENIHPTEVNNTRFPDFFFYNPEVPIYDGGYQNAYRGIYRMNLVLARIEAVEEIPAAMRDQLIAEARFMRGYFYLQLDKYYSAGNKLSDLSVALILSEAEHANQEIARSTVGEVHAAILADLTAGEAGLPTRAQRGQSGRGRATKGAAQMALAELYLWRSSFYGLNEWQRASDAAKRVIDSNQYSLVTNGFFNVFNASNKANNNEQIFFVVATGTNGRSTSGFVNAHGPRDLGFGTGGGFGTQRATRAHVESYAKGDIRGNLGRGTLLPGMFEGDTVAYRDYACSTNVRFQGATPGPNGGFCGKLPFESIYPYKFRPRNLASNQGDVDIPLFRYAETLLMYAEAQNELGNLATAVEYVNRVRARARRGTTGAETRVQPADISAAGQTRLSMREAIYNERNWELAHENKRFFDLVRRDAMEPGYWFAMVSRDPSSTQLLPDLQNRAHVKRFPFSNREIDINPNLVQNPGY